METIAIYSFDELSDDAKENARQWARSTWDFAWMDESIDSIKSFCDHFGVKLTNYQIGAHCSFDYETDAENRHFRGLKLSQFNRDFMPTGYCLDCSLWQTFVDEFKKTSSAKLAFDRALWQGFFDWRSDLNSQLSDEYIDEHIVINEYRFFDNGKFARG